MFKKLFVSTFAVAAFAFVTSMAFAATAENMGTVTLKRGSVGMYAQALQKNLNNCAGASLTADGKFGMMTANAVKAFQTSKGLVSDGLAGAMTRAALTASCAGTTTTTTTTTTTSSLSGTTGDIKNFRELGTYSGETVYEGQVSHNIYQGEIEADAGSDISLSTLKINLVQGNTSGSTLPSRYFSKVRVWVGGTEVGSAMASDFSESGSNYTANIALTNAIVKASTRVPVTVSVDVNSTIDSTDATSNSWTVKFLNTRFSDASGAILTNTPSFTGKTFTVGKLASASIVKAKVSLATDNPVAKTIKVDTSNQTTDQVLLKFTLKAEGTDLKLRTLPIKLTATGDLVSDVVSTVKLTDGTNTLDTYSPSNGTVAETAYFGSSTALNYTIAKDTTKTFTVLANIKAMTAYSAGQLIKAELLSTTGSAPVTTCTTTTQTTFACGLELASIRDGMDNNIGYTSTNRIGSALGDAMTLRTSGVSATVNSVVVGSENRNSTTNNLASQQVTYSLNVSAVGSDFYIARNAEYLPGTGTVSSGVTTTDVRGSAGLTKGISFHLLNSSGYAPAVGEVAATYVNSSVEHVSGGVVDSNGVIRITDGSTATVKFTVTISDHATAATATSPIGQYRVGIDSINAATTSTTTPTVNYSTTPAASFESSNTGAFL